MDKGKVFDDARLSVIHAIRGHLSVRDARRSVIVRFDDWKDESTGSGSTYNHKIALRGALLQALDAVEVQNLRLAEEALLFAEDESDRLIP